MLARDMPARTERTVSHADTPEARPASGSLALLWLHPTREPAPTRLGAEPKIIGRGEGADVVLAGSMLSRRHAELRREGPVPVIRDLDSHNGVFVNGERVHEAPLEKDDVIRIGDWVGVVALADFATGPFAALAPGLLAGPVLGQSLARAREAARSNLPVLIEGESGTGKEQVARAAHEWSGRSGRLVAVNCAAIPERLVEAELFGYRKGAFTGAERGNPGYFRAAHEGTLLLDEVLELPLPAQAKLLRAIDLGEVCALGDSVAEHVDVRVIVAAQSPLESAVSEGRFRGDLFARLSGFVLRLPPLRERRVEIPFLFGELLRRHGASRALGIDAKLIEALCLYSWPYNVRELETEARRLWALQGDSGMLRRSHLDPKIRSATRARTRAAPGARLTRRERQREALIAALALHRGNVTRAARAVGVTKPTAYRMLAEANVDPEQFRSSEREG